jgi:hypothetical protein
MAKDPNRYNEKEAQRRFEAALRGGLNTPPKPLKAVVGKRAKLRPKRKK